MLIALILVSAGGVDGFLPTIDVTRSWTQCFSCEPNTLDAKGSIALGSSGLEPPQKTFLDDGFVFGLQGSGLERPKGKVGRSLTSLPFARNRRVSNTTHLLL